MKKTAIVTIAIGALLAGCVAYEIPYLDGGGPQRERRDGERDWRPNNADRDRAGVPDRHDHRPNTRVAIDLYRSPLILTGRR